jgi:hypothetical protein
MTDTVFSHQKANSPEARYTGGGLRSFFVYRDMGITYATKGALRVQLVRATRKKLGGEGGHWGSFSYCRYPCRLHGQRLGEI